MFFSIIYFFMSKILQILLIFKSEMFYGKKEINYEKKNVFGFLGVFHEIGCHSYIKDVAINGLILYVFFIFLNSLILLFA